MGNIGLGWDKARRIIEISSNLAEAGTITFFFWGISMKVVYVLT